MSINQKNNFLIICFVSLIIFFTLVNAWLGFPFWKTIEGSYSALGGHIPYSDANGYYDGAFTSNIHATLNVFNTRRPVYCLYLSCLQRISNFNFPLTIFLQSCLFAVACSLFAFYVSKKRGISAALFSVSPLILFGMVFLPTTMSENSGLILGALAASVIYYAWNEENVWFYRIGLCIFSVALSARSGCYFVLISLLLLPYFYPFTGSKYKEFLWNVVFIVLGLSFVAALSQFFGSPSGGYQSNFAHTLYGLITGGNRWAFVYEDPRISSLLFDMSGKELDASRVIYEQSWIRFKENPFLLIIGLAKSMGGFIRFLMIGLWRESWQAIHYTYAFTHFSIMAIASYRFYKNRKLYPRDFQFIIFSCVGIILSSAFIWADAGYRVFCTVSVFYGLFIAFGFFPKSTSVEKLRSDSSHHLCLGSIFIFLCVIIIPIISFLKPLNITPPPGWLANTKENDVYVVYNLTNQPGLMVTDNPKTLSIPAQITKERLLMSVDLNKEVIKGVISKIAAQMNQFYLVSTYDFIRKTTFMFILESKPLASDVQWFKLKAIKNQDGLLLARIEESK